LEKSKLTKDDFLPTVQNIYLSGSIACEEYKLLELDQEKIDYLLEGNRLVIRGDDNENAVCCTQNATYSFKVSEISNPLLVCSNLKFASDLKENETRSSHNAQVIYMTNSYFILEKERPKMQKLKQLLELNLYFGQLADENNDAIKYTVKDFLENIQSSEEEIYNYLNYIEAYKIDDNWRLLEPKFYTKMFDNVLKLIDEHSWKPKQIPVEEIYDELKCLYSRSILNQFVNYYFRQSSEGPNIYEINVDRMFHFYAESLLRSATKMRFSEFQTIIRRIIPSSFNFEFDLSCIQDICYVEEPYIYYFNVLDLPDNLEKRFKYLFEKRKKWSFDELKPLIQDLCGFDLAEINNAIMKYCRAFNQNNVKYFTSRV